MDSHRTDQAETQELGGGAGPQLRPAVPELKKDESVAEAIALGVIKERMVAWRGGGVWTNSKRTAPLPPITGSLPSCRGMEIESANCSSSTGEMRPSPSWTTDAAAKPTPPLWPPGSSAEPQDPDSFSQATTSYQLYQPTDEPGSVSDGTLRTLERDRRLDKWLKRHGLSLPLVKLALQTTLAMLGICLWISIPPVYGTKLGEWSNPGWAGITVILLLEPTAGATLAKTVLRVGGTVVGACFSSWLLEALRFALPAVDATLVCCTLPPFCALCAYCKARYKPYAT